MLDLRTLTILMALGTIAAILISGVVLATIQPVGATDGSRCAEAEGDSETADCHCAQQDGASPAPQQEVCPSPGTSEIADPVALPDPEHSLSKPLPIEGQPPL